MSFVIYGVQRTKQHLVTFIIKKRWTRAASAAKPSWTSLSGLDNKDMRYKVGNPVTWVLSPVAIWAVDQAPRQTLYLVKPKPSTRLLLKSSKSLWTSPLTVKPLIYRWVLHEWLLVAETLKTQGVYFLQLRSYSGQEKEPRSPQRLLCSLFKECLDPVDPLYNQNQDPETYKAGAGGPRNPNVFIFSVEVV